MVLNQLLHAKAHWSGFIDLRLLLDGFVYLGNRWGIKFRNILGQLSDYHVKKQPRHAESYQNIPLNKSKG
jgi:hypothetical protein